jgi:Cu+-exporting ATPase
MLFRDAAAIERLREVDTLIVDKTGTLTEGRPAFERSRDRGTGHSPRTKCCAWPPASTRAASIRWPMPSSRAARERGLALDKAGRIRIGSAASACAERWRPRLALGNGALMAEDGTSISTPLAEQAEALRQSGASVMHLAADGACSACWRSPTQSRRAPGSPGHSCAGRACASSWPPATA